MKEALTLAATMHGLMLNCRTDPGIWSLAEWRMAENDDKAAQLEGLLKTLAETARNGHAARSKAFGTGKALPPLLDYDTELQFIDAESLLHEMQEGNRAVEQDFAKLKSGSLPADLHDDAPLKLEDAICLPELAGAFTVAPELRRPSESLTVKTLRLAIERGELRTIRPNTKNLYVTRRFIREWLERCQDQKTTSPFSSSGRNGGTSTARLHTRPSSSSTRTETSTSLASARMILEQLKQPSAPSSPSVTRKK